MEYYLAVDIGASSGRHILGSINNGKIELEEIYRFENNVKKNDAGSLVWDIEELEKNVKNGIREAGRLGKIPKSVAIDTWAVDYVLLDENGKAMLPVYGYRDARTESAPAECEKILPFREHYSATGIQKQNFNTVYQFYCEKKSGRLDKASRFLMIPEYLLYTLTGKPFNEYTNATTTAMVNASSKEWDDGIIEKFGFPKKLFGKITPPCTFAGRFSEETEKFVGFSADCVLCPTHDTASAVAACPVDPKSVYVSSGTWSLIGTELEKAITSDGARNANFTNEGGVEYRFRFLKNYMGMWLFQNMRRNLNKKYTYDEMMQMAMESGYVYHFNVNDPTLTAPDDMISAIKSLIPKKDASLGDIFNATYHSLAKSYDDAIKEIESVSGKRTEKIYIVGGGSKDVYLDLLTAEYTGKRVFVGLNEATAAGNLISQMIYDKKFSDLAEARKAVFDSFDMKEVK